MKKLLLFLVVYIVSTPALRAHGGWGWGLGVPLAIGTTAAIAHHAHHAHDYDDGYYYDDEPEYRYAERPVVAYEEPVVDNEPEYDQEEIEA